jgi:hypothetical protein
VKKEEIAGAIISGLKEACHLSFELKNGDFTNIKPEYLLTVMVAKALVGSNNNRKYTVRLEEPTMIFAQSCVPEHTLRKFVFSGDHNADRNGKIDIALYSDEHTDTSWFRSRASCPIELKGINPDVFEFNLDINRNIGYFLLEDDNTGLSELKLSCFATIFDMPKAIYHSEIEGCKSKVKKKVDKWMKKYNAVLIKNKLSYNLIIEPVFQQLIDESDEGIDQDIISSCHLYFGVIVFIGKA